MSPSNSQAEAKGVVIPTWLMSTIVGAILVWTGAGVVAGIKGFALLSTVEYRVNQISTANLVTDQQLADRLARRDQQIDDLYARTTDLRDQMRRYHGSARNETPRPSPQDPPTNQPARLAIKNKDAGTPDSGEIRPRG